MHDLSQLSILFLLFYNNIPLSRKLQDIFFCFIISRFLQLELELMKLKWNNAKTQNARETNIRVEKVSYEYAIIMWASTRDSVEFIFKKIVNICAD